LLINLFLTLKLWELLNISKKKVKFFRKPNPKPKPWPLGIRFRIGLGLGLGLGLAEVRST